MMYVRWSWKIQFEFSNCARNVQLNIGAMGKLRPLWGTSKYRYFSKYFGMLFQCWMSQNEEEGTISRLLSEDHFSLHHFLSMYDGTFLVCNVRIMQQPNGINLNESWWTSVIHCFLSFCTLTDCSQSVM